MSSRVVTARINRGSTRSPSAASILRPLSWRGEGKIRTLTGPERGLSSPQQRRTAGGLQALTGTVGRPRVAADWKVRAPVAVPRCAHHAGGSLVLISACAGSVYVESIVVPLRPARHG